MKTRPHSDMQAEISHSSAVAAVLNHLRLSAEKFGAKNFELILDNTDTGLMHLGLEYVDFHLDDAPANRIYRRFVGSSGADETASLINEVAELFDEHPDFNRFIEEFEAISPGKGLQLRNHLLAQAVIRILQVCITQCHEAWFAEWQNLQEERNKVIEGAAPYADLVEKKRDQISEALLWQQKNVKANIEASLGVQRSVNKMVMHYEHVNLGYKFRPAIAQPAPISKLRVLSGAKQIDLFALNRESRELLAALLEAYPAAKFFDAKDPATKKSMVYLVPDPLARHPGQMRKIKLKHSLVRYTRKKNSQEDRFAVCHVEPIDAGSYGVIYESIATLTMRYNKNGHIVGLSCKSKHLAKERAVKRFLYARPVLPEYEMAQKILLLHAKDAVMSHDLNRAALVMHRIKGGGLVDQKRLKSSTRGVKSMFSFEQRLSLTIMMGEAIINQVQANQIIHRDLKPDNLLVELDQHNNPIAVVVIDYGLAKAKDGIAEEGVSTHAPEVLRDHYPESDEKSDAYAYAVMLDYFIWNNEVMSGVAELEPEQKVLLESVIESGLRSALHSRASLPEMVGKFKLIQAECLHRAMQFPRS